jgi:hypothetical protein
MVGNFLIYYKNIPILTKIMMKFSFIWDYFSNTGDKQYFQCCFTKNTTSFKWKWLNNMFSQVQFT